MAKLTGQSIASSYDQLLIVDDANGISASLQAVESADTGGSASSLKISTSKVEVIPASDSTALFEVSRADGTAVLSVDTTNARCGIGTAAPDDLLHIVSSDEGNLHVERTTTAQNTPTSIAHFHANSSNNISDGFGTRIKFIAEDDSNVEYTLGSIGAVRDGADTEGALCLYSGTNGTEEFMRIDSAGNVGIGRAPSYNLDVDNANGINAIFRGDDSNSWFAISSDQSNNSAGYSIIRSDSATALTFDGHNMDMTIGGSYSPFTGAHTAQLIDDEEYHYGELVQIQGLIQSGKDIVYQVNKTTGSYQRNVLGAFGYIEDYPEFNNAPVSRSSAEDEYMIYVIGDGHILCNGEKGNLAVGDGICSSTTVGQGMKADKMAMCIGIAQATASFTGSETQLVPVQYGLQQFTPWTD